MPSLNHSANSIFQKEVPLYRDECLTTITRDRVSRLGHIIGSSRQTKTDGTVMESNTDDLCRTVFNERITHDLQHITT